jgi:PAS domain S-box-containing protein
MDIEKTDTTIQDVFMIAAVAFLGAALVNVVGSIEDHILPSAAGWITLLVCRALAGGVAGLVIGYLFLKHRRAETSLRALNDNLDQLVRTRTRELQKANDDLKNHINRCSRVETALQETVMIQQAILDNIPDMAWLKDKGGKFIAANDSFAKAAGISEEELVGKTDFDFWPDELARRYRQDDENVMQSCRRKSIEETLVNTKEREIWIETIKSPIFNEREEVIGTVGIARDITERKRVEEKADEQGGESLSRVSVPTNES